MKYFVVIGILALSAFCQAQSLHYLQNGLSGRRQHGGQGLSGYSGDNDWGYYGEAGAPGSDYFGYSGQWAPLDFDYNSLPGLSGYNHEQQDYEEDGFRHVRSVVPQELEMDKGESTNPAVEMDGAKEDSEKSENVEDSKKPQDMEDSEKTEDKEDLENSEDLEDSENSDNMENSEKSDNDQHDSVPLNLGNLNWDDVEKHTPGGSENSRPKFGFPGSENKHARGFRKFVRGLASLFGFPTNLGRNLLHV
ncbi:uncharacterized protein LOC142241449 isoform X1 [Haematobia irritans]|uniref:uncharacterized protein LOC142241449 isoform X1 n=1 Tax=Haematobia irritans TaxID=7368 RepID=UPI003F4F9B62